MPTFLIIEFEFGAYPLSIPTRLSEPRRFLSPARHLARLSTLWSVMAPTRSNSGLLGILLTACTLFRGGLAQYDEYGDDDYPPYGGYDDDVDGAAGGGGPAPPALSTHVAGIADVDPATFDKVVYAASRPTFVTFYDSADESEKLVAAKWALDHATDKLANHVRLLMAKVRSAECIVAYSPDLVKNLAAIPTSALSMTLAHQVHDGFYDRHTV